MWHSFCNSDINSLQIKKTVLSLIRLQEYSVIKCFLNPTNRGKDISNYQNFLYAPLREDGQLVLHLILQGTVPLAFEQSTIVLMLYSF